jgi:hypothetical protein
MVQIALQTTFVNQLVHDLPVFDKMRQTVEFNFHRRLLSK